MDNRLRSEAGLVSPIPIDHISTAASLLDRRFRGGATIPLLHAPLHITSQPLEDGTRYDVTFDTNPLDAKRFLQVLRAASPAPGAGDNAFGVIADWNVVDRAQEPAADRAQGLVALHEQLGGPWVEFMKSRPAFLDMLTDARQPFTFLYRTNVPTGAFPAAELTRYNLLLDETEREQASRSPESMVLALEKLGITTGESMALKALQAHVNARRQRHRQSRNPNKLSRIYQRWGTSLRHAFLARVVNTLPHPGLEEAAQATRQERFGTLIADDGSEHVYPLDRYPHNLQEVFTGNRERIVDGSYEGVKVTVPLLSNGREEIVLSSSIRRTRPPTAMLPTISWVNKDNAGDREFIIGRSTETTSDHTIHRDGVLGILTVAAFAPEIVRTWPKKMRIRGSRDQQMGTAQVPVLALMRQKQLLRSRFVGAVEASVAA